MANENESTVETKNLPGQSHYVSETDETGLATASTAPKPVSSVWER